MDETHYTAGLPPRTAPVIHDLRLSTPPASFLRNRWVQLTAGVLAMVAVANLQYGWTFFVKPIHQKFGWDPVLIQVAFTLFVLTETWLVPFEAYLADRHGPAPLLLAGGLLVALAWTVNAAANSLALLYTGAVLGGTGAGIVYGVSMGSALKWFPDRRGLAAGLTAAAFGAGSALTVVPIHNTIRDFGYESAFLWFGLGQGAVVLLAALVLRAPRRGETPPPAAARVRQSGRDFTPIEMLRTPTFWLLYVMLTMITTGGLLIIAQIAPMAEHYGVADSKLSILGITVVALPFAMQIDRVLNGVTRPFFGWVSDHIGRELTMFIAFTLEGFAILLLLNLAQDPVLFVVLSGLTFFAWGEAFSLFPALCGDLFGRKYATTNYGLLYTAKGTAALFVLLGSHLKELTGSWVPIFAVAVVFDWLTALLALLVLPRMRAGMAPAKTGGEEGAKA
jgi:OFA family oxalate/formate antiporter-like MFS transporter